ncbi:hypothetical protein [Sphingomonas turrisvirgatae]|nr:hypothetical protein [Sphingomonas turrisvirgatae]
MADQNETHISTTEARSGATPHMTRYVLGFGLLLVIIVFAIFLAL